MSSNANSKRNSQTNCKQDPAADSRDRTVDDHEAKRRRTDGRSKISQTGSTAQSSTNVDEVNTVTSGFLTQLHATLSATDFLKSCVIQTCFKTCDNTTATPYVSR